MKILVYGAGPLGSLIASRLHEAGHDVSILARRQRLADIKEYGIVIKEEGMEKEEVAHVPPVETLDPEDYYDLVMIVMRKNQAEEIIPILAANRKVPTYLFMMNNAADPKLIGEKLGEGRLMLGFPYPGGERDKHLIRVPAINEKKKWTIPIGEIDGEVNDRTRQVADTLRSMRGYKVQIRTDMDAWLKYHAALLMPAFAPAMYAADINMKRLGRTRDLLILTTRGIREAVRGLRKEVGIPPSPKGFRIFEYLPEPIWVALYSWMMKKEFAKDSLEGHPKTGRDELKMVADELMDTLHGAGVKTPAIDQLMPYYDPEVEPYPDGGRDIPMRWGGLFVSLIIVLILVLLLVI